MTVTTMYETEVRIPDFIGYDNEKDLDVKIEAMRRQTRVDGRTRVLMNNREGHPICGVIRGDNMRGYFGPPWLIAVRAILR